MINTIHPKRLTLGELQEKLATIRYTTDKDAKLYVSDSTTNEDGNEYIHISNGSKTIDIQITF